MPAPESKHEGLDPGREPRWPKSRVFAREPQTSISILVTVSDAIAGIWTKWPIRAFTQGAIVPRAGAGAPAAWEEAEAEAPRAIAAAVAIARREAKLIAGA